jgi:hypothetical protein
MHTNLDKSGKSFSRQSKYKFQSKKVNELFSYINESQNIRRHNDVLQAFTTFDCKVVFGIYLQ